MASDEPTDLLTIDDVAARFRVSRTTVRRWEQDGRLRSHRISDRVVRFRRADVEALLSPVVDSPAVEAAS